jgi:hypothetical protein
MKGEPSVRRAMCLRLTALLLVGGLAQWPAMADETKDRLQQVEKRLEDSLQLIQRLEARLVELERERAARISAAGSAPSAGASAPSFGMTAPTPAQANAQGDAIQALRDEVNQLAEGLSKSPPDTGLPLHGFADVGAGWSKGTDPLRERGFGAGTFDLYLVPQIGDHVRSLIEVAFEYNSGGELEADVERLQIGYTLNDDLTVWLGRFHTPFGLWNTWFHHGANLQTSITRPRFIEFEDKGGIIPAHSVGLWASGKFGVGGDKVSYDAYVSNGPSIRKRQLDFNPFTDDNNNKMFGLNLGYHPSGLLYGLSAGVHGFSSIADEVTTSNDILSRTRLRMAGAYLGYDVNDYEAIAEYYHFFNSDVATGTRYPSTAWFAQVGRTFGSLTPYVRYERASLNPNDPYFTSLQTGRSYRRSVAGVRYALDSRSSFKFELSDTREYSVVLIDEVGLGVPFTGASYRRAAFQYSIAF